MPKTKTSFDFAAVAAPTQKVYAPLNFRSHRSKLHKQMTQDTFRSWYSK